MADEPTREESIATLQRLIGHIRVAMMTTLHEDQMQSRPMATTKAPFDGTLSFFTDEDTTKAEDLKRNPMVNLAYADPQRHAYISVVGEAELLHDQAKMEELWEDFYKTWFPKGLADPQLRLLRVNVHSAEYWDAKTRGMQRLTGVVKEFVTGAAGGEHEHKQVDLRNSTQR